MKASIFLWFSVWSIKKQPGGQNTHLHNSPLIHDYHPVPLTGRQKPKLWSVMQMSATQEQTGSRTRQSTSPWKAFCVKLSRSLCGWLQSGAEAEMLVCRKEILVCPVNVYFRHDCNIGTKVSQMWICMVCMFLPECVCGTVVFANPDMR